MQVGIEYEGVIVNSKKYYRYTTKFSNYVFYSDPAKNIEGNNKGLINGPWINRDGYTALAELRMIPVDSEILPRKFFGMFESAMKATFDSSVAWTEREIPIDDHKEALEWLDKADISREVSLRTSLKRKTGEHIKYNFKQPLTIIKDEIKLWDSDKECRMRGGGIHINISPIKPEDVKQAVLTLHENLFNLNAQFGFKSNYRQQLLFRYRIYEGDIPGFEYMSLGMRLDQLYEGEVIEFFAKIFNAVNKIKDKYENNKT